MTTLAFKVPAAVLMFVRRVHRILKKKEELSVKDVKPTVYDLN